MASPLTDCDGVQRAARAEQVLCLIRDLHVGIEKETALAAEADKRRVAFPRVENARESFADESVARRVYHRRRVPGRYAAGGRGQGAGV